MAIINKGILGGVSGKVGNVVGGSWKGVDYLRSLPAGVKQANSILQQAQRMKFKVLLEFLQPQVELLRIGFKPDAVKMTAFNAALSYNYQHALLGDFETGFAVDYAAALVAKGNLPAVESLVAESTVAGQISLSWSDNSAQNLAAATDVLFVSCLNPDTKTAYITLNAASRADGSALISLPAPFHGSSLQCYAGFFAIDVLIGTASKNGVSNSVYAGLISVS